MANKLKLRECPFCGNGKAPKSMSVAEMEGSDSDWCVDWKLNHFLVVCDFNNTGCGASTGYHYESEEAAVEAWNRRCYE